jgi:hypothetical protein
VIDTGASAQPGGANENWESDDDVFHSCLQHAAERQN